MLSRIFLLIFLLSSIHLMSNMSIKVTAEPALPVKNLLKNPSFEEGEKTPLFWADAERSHYFRWTREYLWLSKVEKVIGAGLNGSNCIRQEVDVDSILSELFIRQAVPVKKQTIYRAEIWTRLRYGRAYLHLIDHMVNQGSLAKMKYKYLISWHENPILDDFIDVAWIKSPAPTEWKKLESELSSGDGEVIYFDFGAYYGKASADYDDAFLGEAFTEMTILAENCNAADIIVSDDFDKIIFTGKVEKEKQEIVLKDLRTDRRYKIQIKSVAGKEKNIWYP